MTLRAKFGVLLALLTLTVAVALAASLLYGAVLQRELVWPFERTSAVLSTLNRLKRHVGEQTALLPGPGRDVPGLGAAGVPAPTDPLVTLESALAALVPAPAPPPELVARYRDIDTRIQADIQTLQRIPSWSGSGASASAENLLSRIREARALAERWFVTGARSVGRTAGDAHYEIHELIERIEGQLNTGAVLAVDYTHDLRRIHAAVIIAGMAIVLLAGLLGYMLHLRWVVRPVQTLRAAADEIARGNFAHQAPVLSTDELGMLTREVNEMAGTISTMQAEAVERERLAAVGEMVRRLAHNIRNPLAGIRSLAELTKQRLEINPVSAAGDQDKIIQAVDRFNQWLGELLRATSPLKIEPRDTPVRPWLIAILQAHAPLAQARGVSLEAHLDAAPDHAVFDPHHLEHAIVAILTNALQATPEGGRVRLAASSPTPDRWQITIADTGPGISPDLVERIFRPYFTTKRDGNGIGLAVAQQVVRGHAGSISVLSEPGRGATFVVDLPRVLVQPEWLGSAEAPAANSQSKGAGGGANSGHRG